MEKHTILDSQKKSSLLDTMTLKGYIRSVSIFRKNTHQTSLLLTNKTLLAVFILLPLIDIRTSQI